MNSHKAFPIYQTVLQQCLTDTRCRRKEVTKWSFQSVAEKGKHDYSCRVAFKEASWKVGMTKRALLHPSFHPSSQRTECLYPCATHWAEAGTGLPTWSLQATRHRHSPNDRTDKLHCKLGWGKNTALWRNITKEPEWMLFQILWGFC